MSCECTLGPVTALLSEVESSEMSTAAWKAVMLIVEPAVAVKAVLIGLEAVEEARTAGKKEIIC